MSRRPAPGASDDPAQSGCHSSIGGFGNVLWRRWLRQPQAIWLRRALFQVHLWTGMAVGLYVIVVGLTGSVLVYSNELYLAATPTPILVAANGPRLSDGACGGPPLRGYPGFEVTRLSHPRNPRRAREIKLVRGAA